MSSSSRHAPGEVPPTEGRVAGKFELVRLLGRGGMGSVWEARHVSLGTRVAIKFVDLDKAANDEARSRFETEAKAAASIVSKHAIKVYDHGLLDDGRPYIVMELLMGEPLDRRLDRVERLSLVETARLLSQVARALQQAHDAGITHRDLKPENIFLERGDDDDDDTAKVLDFGIAKLRDPITSLPSSSSTKSGVLMGTPFYMSPEQARGLKTVNARSDLWALGVIVFRCVTGELPFDGESLGDLLVKICAGPIPVPSERWADAPPALDAWMKRALEREPEARFTSALAMADALAALAGLPPRTSNPRSESPTPPISNETAATESDLSRLEGMDGPIAVATSSPLTANATPLPMTKSGGMLRTALLAGGLVAAFVVTFEWMHRAPAPTKEQTQATVASSPPAASAVPSVDLPFPEPVPVPLTPEPTVAAATPPKTLAPAASLAPPTPRARATKLTPLPMVAPTPKASATPSTPRSAPSPSSPPLAPPPGSDPGY